MRVAIARAIGAGQQFSRQHAKRADRPFVEVVVLARDQVEIRASHAARRLARDLALRLAPLIPKTGIRPSSSVAWLGLVSRRLRSDETVPIASSAARRRPMSRLALFLRCRGRNRSR